MSGAGYRTEYDSLGEKQIPEDAYYGIQSERARENFNVSGTTLGDFPPFVRAIAAIKKAAALANCQSGALEDFRAEAISAAAREIMDGKFKDQFLIDIFQGGGGTSANMNLNEVIANRANEMITGKKGYDVIHPNTHVNMSQSTNDVIPSAMKIACYDYLDQLEKSAGHLESALRAKEKEFGTVVKIGRTCLQDALPLTLGQEFSGYAACISRRRVSLQKARELCLVLPLGATAVGTQAGVRKGYIDRVYPALSAIVGFEVKMDPNLFDGLQNADVYIEISAAIKALATSAAKMASDFRLMASGPNAGLAEISLPAVQPGSSIMPGKTNPVMPELIKQISFYVCGNDTAITLACAGGELELNVWEPLIIKSIAESATILARGMVLLADRCVLGIRANAATCRRGAEASMALAAVIAALFDYPTGSRIAKLAADQKKSIKGTAISEGLLTPEEAEELLDPLLLTDGSRFAQAIENYKRKHDVNF